MRMRAWLLATIIGVFIFGGATGSVAQTQEVRQAFAPTGKLRVGLQLGSPSQAIKDPASGELKGVGVDLGKALAQRLGVPFEPVLLPSIGVVLDQGKTGAWDVAFFGYSEARTKDWDYAPIHLEVDFGYLVPAGSPVTSIDKVDVASNRIAVQERSQPDRMLTSLIKRATIVRAPSNDATLEALKAGQANLIFSIKPNLYVLSQRLMGSRVLDGRVGIDPHAMAMPKGRDAARAYARQFIEQAKAEGVVAAAIQRVGLRGVAVAAAK